MRVGASHVLSGSCRGGEESTRIHQQHARLSVTRRVIGGFDQSRALSKGRILADPRHHQHGRLPPARHERSHHRHQQRNRPAARGRLRRRRRARRGGVPRGIGRAARSRGARRRRRRCGDGRRRPGARGRVGGQGSAGEAPGLQRRDRGGGHLGDVRHGRDAPRIQRQCRGCHAHRQGRAAANGRRREGRVHHLEGRIDRGRTVGRQLRVPGVQGGNEHAGQEPRIRPQGPGDRGLRHPPGHGADRPAAGAPEAHGDPGGAVDGGDKETDREAGPGDDGELLAL